MKVGNMIFSEPKYRVANGKLISYDRLISQNKKGEGKKIREIIQQFYIR